LSISKVDQNKRGIGPRYHEVDADMIGFPKKPLQLGVLDGMVHRRRRKGHQESRQKDYGA